MKTSTMMLRWLQTSTVVAAGMALAACGGSSGAAPPVIPPPTPPPVQHLYVPDARSSGVVREYALPLTATSMPIAVTAGIPNEISAAVSSTANTLAVGDTAGNVMTFPLPLANGASPSATFPSSTSTQDGQLVWSSGGMLYVTTQSPPVEIFSSPFSNGSVPSGSIASTLTQAIGTVYDSLGNLYIFDSSAPTIAIWNGSSVTTITTSTSDMRGAASNGMQLFVAKATSPVGVLVFSLPLVSGTPSFEITSGLTLPEGTAVDTQGNLYVSDFGTGNISVYNPPFSAASTPSVVLHTPAVPFFIAIGK